MYAVDDCLDFGYFKAVDLWFELIGVSRIWTSSSVSSRGESVLRGGVEKLALGDEQMRVIFLWDFGPMFLELS
jgi:hypothetical protein